DFVVRGRRLLPHRHDQPDCLLALAFGQTCIADKAVQMSHERSQYLAQARVFDAGDGRNDRICQHGLIFDDHGTLPNHFSNNKAGGPETRRLSDCSMSLAHTLTSGPREAGPFDPPPGPLLGPPPGPLGLGLRGTVRLRAPGNFSGFGVTGPSKNSKPIFSCGSAAVSSLTRTTRTWPPPLSLPNSTSSAKGFLMCSWITRAMGRAPICSSYLCWISHAFAGSDNSIVT